MPGPPKKPSQNKKLEGTFRKDRVAKNEMQPAASPTMPRPPQHFNATAKKIWYEVTEELSRLKMLINVDLPLLGVYCFNAALVEEAQKNLEEHGYLSTITNKGGHSYEIPSPWVKIHNDAIEKVIKSSSLFGFNPSARTKISMPEPSDEGDELDKLLRR
jgi:P27 family predicted phage terminase small subunit